ncbi:ATP-binding cassette domain-containing protein [Cellulomonas sp. P22]|uniref:ABC transporter ATP-binding protein/permease n=1 Tax=Cellulomonas sp. P22 TaxID=3373189 RepID=UPI003792CAD6
MPDLELRDVRRVFAGTPAVTALDGVTMTITQGEFVAIVGPSGGGKSTLLNILGLLDAPTEGSYLIGGVDTAGMSDSARTRHRSDTFAFVFQAFHLLERRPVTASVELGLMYRGVKVSERARLAREALGRVGLGGFPDRDSSLLSGGERQRVALARALATTAPVLLADEPTGNLDSATSATVVEYLRQVHQSGVTVVLVTHDLSVAAVADRQVFVRDGRLVDQSPVSSGAALAASPTSPPGRGAVLRRTDVLRDAIGSLVSRRGRTLGLVTAVAVGVALVIATLGLSQSARSQVTASFDAHSNKQVTVAWPPASTPDGWGRDSETLVAGLEGLAGVTAAGLVDDHGPHSLQLSLQRKATEPTVVGISGRLPVAAEMDITWSGEDRVLDDDEVLLGRTLATQVALGPLSGRPRVLLDGREVSVAGIVESSTRVPQAVAAVVVSLRHGAAFGQTTYRRAIIMTLAGAAPQVAQQSRTLIDPADELDLDVSAPVDPGTLRAEVESDVRTTLLVLSLIAVVASVLSLGNAMVMSVLDRRQEIGMRRAIGARARHIIALVLHESALIGAAGGVVGLALGFAGILGITISQQWAPVFDVRLAPLAVGAGIGIGALGGLLAAIRAARIDPSAALRL